MRERGQRERIQMRERKERFMIILQLCIISHLNKLKGEGRQMRHRQVGCLATKLTHAQLWRKTDGVGLDC